MKNNIMGVCPICGRDMIEGSSINKHHLVPRSKEGTETILIHKICHDKIHSLFSERELAQVYNTVEKLLEHEEMLKFVRWVRKQGPEYYSKSRRHKMKRRRI